MADRTITARLRLVHSEFTKGAREASRSVTELGHEISKSSKRSSSSWTELGKKTSDLGSSMTTRLTLPIVAIGGAAVKMANDFGNVFTQMQATAGVAEEEVEGLKDSVLSLAGETGRGPKELAEALLLIRSSGFQGAAAMDVLEISAKGAAAGMGETAEIANAITNVVNGYGQANITAAEAMDVLTSSVKEGKAEAADMAPQFGRLVPLAAELKIKFSDVGGSLAFLTKSTGDAAQSSTALQGIMSKLLRPSQQGAEALKVFADEGTSIREMLQEKGLLGTLETLRERLGDSGFQLVFDDVQALNGALQLTGPGLEDARQVIENVADSAGAADAAFETWGKSMGAKNSRAWATAQAAMISFGDIALPMVASLAEMLTGLIGVLAELPDGVKEIILIFGAMVAAMGPVLKVGGQVMQLWGTVSKLTAGGFAATSAAAIALTVTIGAAVYGLTQLVQKGIESKKRIEEFADALEQGGDKAKVSASHLLEAALQSGKIGTLLKDAGADLDTFVDQIRDGGDAARDLQEDFQSKMNVYGGDWKKILSEAVESGGEFEKQIQDIAEAQDLTGNQTQDLINRIVAISDEYNKGSDDAKKNAEAQDELADSAAEAGLAVDEQGNLVDATTQKVEDLTAALDELLGRYLSVDDSIKRQNELVLGLSEHFKDMSENYKGHALDLDLTTAAGIKNSDMLDGLVSASSDTVSTMLEQGATSKELRDQWAKDRGELVLVIEKFRAAGQDVSKYDDLLGEIDAFVATAVLTPGLGAAEAGLDALHTRIQQLDGSSVTVNVNTRHTTSTGRMGGVPLYHEGGVVPGRRGEEVAGILQAGERVLALDDPINKALSSPMASGLSIGGGGGGRPVTVFLDMRGAVVADRTQFRRMVRDAWNDLAAGGQVTVRGKRVA